MKPAIVALAIVLSASPLYAQDAPLISIRPFLDVRNEKFRATKTFDAIFGETTARFWGGGVQVTMWRGRVYGELGASRLWKKNAELVGQRVFVSNGSVYRLGIPLRSTIKPVELTGGYRFDVVHPRIIPYLGGGIGSYRYTEQSDFAEASENVDVSHRGGIFDVGVEMRVHRWIGVAVDAHYTHVPGILGEGGVSGQFANDTQSAAEAKRERNLGGWAGRFKVVVGR